MRRAADDGGPCDAIDADWPVKRGDLTARRRMVSAAVASALPPPRMDMPPRGSKRFPFKPVIDDILRADLDVPRKQRHTVSRIVGRRARIDEPSWLLCSTRSCGAGRFPACAGASWSFDGSIAVRDAR